MSRLTITHNPRRWQGPLLASTAALLLAAPRPAAGAEIDKPEDLSFDELIAHVNRYGDTEERRKNRAKAKKEIKARGADGLAYMMDNIHIENISIRLIAQEMVNNFDKTNVVPVLVARLDAEAARTRKYAAYFLSFHDAPEHADDVRPLLDDAEVAGAAMRALGKWKVAEAAAAIVPFLAHEMEMRRIAAANALREIGDPATLPALIAALDDPYFTVRCSVVRALAAFGTAAEKPLLQALPGARDPTRRHIIYVLGEIGSVKATRPLRALLRDDDWGVRGEAARALLRIDADKAERWLRVLDRDNEHPFVRSEIRVPGDLDP